MADKILIKDVKMYVNKKTGDMWLIYGQYRMDFPKVEDLVESMPTQLVAYAKKYPKKITSIIIKQLKREFVKQYNGLL